MNGLLARDRRVLCAGQPGVGKSTLVTGLGRELGRWGRACQCIGADPGSPHFGVPGAISLGRWVGEGWALEAMEALGTLDAGRFRLPLVTAVGRLGRRLHGGMVVVDGPGVVRGNAGAELLRGLVETAGIDLVLMVARADGPLPLARELAALPVEVVVVAAARAAARPGKGARGRHRTALWEAYLGTGAERDLALADLRLTGAPPPAGQPDAWAGRQVALLDDAVTVAMGEVRALAGETLRVRLPAGARGGGALLVRDAARLADGYLGTRAPFAGEHPAPAAPAPPADTTGAMSGRQVAGRVGAFDVTLVNGVFGDPLLHLRLRHARRSLLFDLGKGRRLSARVAHQVSDVFISHAHMDHIAGFLWLLRSRIGDFPACRLYGPPGLADNVEGLVRGVLWDRVGDAGPRFDVFELHGEYLHRFAVQAGRAGCRSRGETPAPGGLLWVEPAFRVRAATLDHGTPVLAYALEPARQINVRKDRLAARALAPGPWLGELKGRVHGDEGEALISLPDGHRETAAALAADLLLVSPGKKLVYATDFRDSGANHRRLAALARDAHTLFCEASFRLQDMEQAHRNQHLTTRACADIAGAAGVSRLVPFHFSRRYEDDPAAVYEEIEAIFPHVFVPCSAGDPEA